MKTISFTLLLLSLATLGLAKEKTPATYTIRLPAAADFSSLDWLTGEWTGKTTVKSPPGDLHLSVAYDLGKRVMIFRERVSFAAADTTPASEESWMGILSPSHSGSPYILQVYSSTGFVTRYQVETDGAKVTFVSSGGQRPPAGWLLRRTIERTGPAEFTETVEVAPPSRPFFDYYSATFTRVPPATPAQSPASH